MKTYISGLFFFLAFARFLYNYFIDFELHGNPEATALAVLGILSHMVFERGEVSK